MNPIQINMKEKVTAKPEFEGAGKSNNNTVSYLRPIASQEAKMQI